MSKIQKFITKGATITVNNTTTLHFNRNKWDQIKALFVFTVGYKCKEYVLLHELQGYLTDKVIEPETDEEFTEGLISMDNPYYVVYYHMLHDKISISSNEDGHHLLPHDSFNGNIYLYENEELDGFHLFKVNESSWTEVELNLARLKNKGFVEWFYFANGMLCK